MPLVVPELTPKLTQGQTPRLLQLLPGVVPLVAKSLERQRAPEAKQPELGIRQLQA
jgi:hypothetical protein